MAYISPARFRRMGTGSDLTGIGDDELASILEDASSKVDRYCNAPEVPNKYSFLGGTMVGEESPISDKLDRRVQLVATPIKQVTDFRIMITNIDYVAPNLGHLYIEKRLGWIEPIPLGLTYIGLSGLATLTPGLGLYHPQVRVTYDYGWEFPVTDLKLFPEDTFTTYAATHQFWFDDVDHPVSIKVNGVVQGSGFTVDPYEGTVTFNTPLTSSDVVTASFIYPLPFEIARATALIATQTISERQLVASGMGNLTSIRVAEITLTRQRPSPNSTPFDNDMPDAAQVLLAGFIFRSIR
jgi:hypothetical protein